MNQFEVETSSLLGKTKSDFASSFNSPQFAKNKPTIFCH